MSRERAMLQHNLQKPLQKLTADVVKSYFKLENVSERSSSFYIAVLCVFFNILRDAFFLACVEYRIRRVGLLGPVLMMAYAKQSGRRDVSNLISYFKTCSYICSATPPRVGC